MTAISTPVICSVCGKRVRAVERAHGGYQPVTSHSIDRSDIPRWQRPVCPGSHRTDHQPAPRKKSTP